MEYSAAVSSDSANILRDASSAIRTYMYAISK